MQPIFLAHGCGSSGGIEPLIVDVALGHERRFRDVRDESALHSTPEGLRQRSEPTLRANC